MKITLFQAKILHGSDWYQKQNFRLDFEVLCSTIMQQLLRKKKKSNVHNMKIILYQKGYFKGNPNYEGILDWILQILHYYYRKQHKNIENSRIIEQNLILSLPFCLLRLVLPGAFLNGRVFPFLEHSTPRILNVTSYHSCRIQFRFLNRFLPS